MNDSPAETTKSEGRILVLESDETLVSSILSALHEAAPAAVVDVAHNLEEAHRIARNDRPDLFVLDMDDAHDSGQDFLLDLRSNQPNAGAIILTSEHSTARPEWTADTVHFLEKPFSHSDFAELVRALLRPAHDAQRHRILVIDDSLMLVSFVQEILTEANYEVFTAGTAQEGLQATHEHKPDLILLDYLLPDLRGDDVSRLLSEELTVHIPVIFMSGFGADLENAESNSANVQGVLSKPFTSELLLKAVEQHLPKNVREEGAEREPAIEPAMSSEFTNVTGPENESAPAVASSPLWNETAFAPPQSYEQAHSGFGDPNAFTQPTFAAAPIDFASLGNIYFSGDTDFFSFSCALRVIGREKLTGALRCFGTKESVDLYTREGKVVLVTTRDPELYCSEAPITLVNIDPERVDQARATQSQTGCPLFITLAREDLIVRDPALQLAQHYGQKLFAQLWSALRVRFAFEQTNELPDFTQDVPAEEDIEHWMLSTLRFAQVQDVAEKANYDPSWIPAYTRYGFERVQKLRLTVAEAQFASQFNGSRSIAQIARNLRLDLKFARLTLFRFVELEIVECWPPGTSEKAEGGGVFKRLGRSIGIGE